MHHRSWSPFSDLEDADASAWLLPAQVCAHTEVGSVGGTVHRAGTVDGAAVEMGQYWLEMIRLELMQAPASAYRLPRPCNLPITEANAAEEEAEPLPTLSPADPAPPPREEDGRRQSTGEDTEQEGLVDAASDDGSEGQDADDAEAAQAPARVTSLAASAACASRAASDGSERHAEERVARPDSAPCAWIAKLDRTVPLPHPKPLSRTAPPWPASASLPSCRVCVATSVPQRKRSHAYMCRVLCVDVADFGVPETLPG